MSSIYTSMLNHVLQLYMIMDDICPGVLGDDELLVCVCVCTCTHHRQTELVHPHRQHREEGAAAPLQPQEAEEIRLVTKSTHKLLQMHNREHPGGLYHRLVRQLLHPQP